MKTQANGQDFTKFVLIVGALYLAGRFFLNRLNGSGSIQNANVTPAVVAGVRS